jgi:hypothetical protein
MRRILLPACLVTGAILGYLLVSPWSPSRRVPRARAERNSRQPELLRERGWLLARRQIIARRLADRARTRQWVELLREPVRTVARTEDPETGTIRLIVRDPNGVPVAGRRLQLSSTWESYDKKVRTDEEGVVRVDGVPPGSLYLSMDTTGGRRSLNADVMPGFMTEILVVAPKGSATVTGVLRDREQGALAGAGIHLSMRLGIYSDTLRAKTGEEGRFVFQDVPPGPWTLQAIGGPLGPKRRPTAEVVVPGEGECVVDLLAGVESLSGMVQDVENDGPLARVLIRLSGPGSDQTSWKQTSDDNGRYRFLDLPPGKWKVEAIRDGHVRWHGGPVSIGPGEAKRLDIPMQTATEVVVVVLDAKGTPYTGRVGVSFRSPGQKWVSYATLGLASEKGEIRYRELPPGEYEVWARASGSDGQGMTLHTFVAGAVNRVEVRLTR